MDKKDEGKRKKVTAMNKGNLIRELRKKNKKKIKKALKKLKKKGEILEELLRAQVWDP